MSVSGSGSYVEKTVMVAVCPKKAGTDCLTAPGSWTVGESCRSKMTVRTEWTKAFRENVSLVANAVATSIYNNFSTGLKSTTESGFTTYPTSNAPFRATYTLSLQANAAQIKKWAGETAEKPPFKDWFDQYIRPVSTAEKSEALSLLKNSDASITVAPQGGIDHEFIGSMLDILGQRIETLVRGMFDQFRENSRNKDLRTEVKWNPKEQGSFLASKGPSWPSLHVSAWLDKDCVAKIEQENKDLLEGLKLTSNSSSNAQLSESRSQYQPQPSISFFSRMNQFFARLLYPIRWLFGKA